MIEAAKIINYMYIRDRVLCLRLFDALCESMSLQHHHLIFHAEVIRFLQGRFLARFFDLIKNQINFYLNKIFAIKELSSEKL